MSPSNHTTDSQDDQRLKDPLEYERGFWGRGIVDVAGVDEVGRGPLAGPVVAAAVVLHPGRWIEGAADSKTLGPKVRSELYDQIVAQARCLAIGAASAREIDRVNILRATALAMERALRSLARPPGHVVVDGLPVRDLPMPHEAIVGGDGLVHSIACASIVAKVVRDRLMCRLAAKHPRYRWDSNMGYGTPDHLRALSEWGPSPHHRLTFRPSQMELEMEG
jgi:ribonuclease HII